ncbi:ABC transporter ATP-binding protein [Pseudoclavibacter endophyticus]|uniref:ABC transporter ATP-binding protein n=1 Tax=Pseudoclavibacter endophyticus TaxID=1778590 RepID=A0A6H9WQB7_9MICO|nr:ABC transporter ATP-binding protein [Pseudoclavibacter endophyticus]KAB1649187.1 ABC transporter ATP-binding protein [Pseudoclavibacter endophyticus]
MTTTTTALLEVEHVTHIYGQGDTAHRAISDLNFSLGERELGSIVGPSGAGKTTLLRILSGLMKPTEGTVRIGGADVDGVPEGMAMVFQDYGRSLLPWLTVERNVAFPLKGVVKERTERDRLVAESLEAVGLATASTRHPWQLSGGMQQRVAIARALASRPRLLLMDEPFASLDAQTRAGLEDLVLRIREQFGITVLVVTHDIDEAVYLADRVLVLSKSPAHLLDDVRVTLPEPRDQISSREHDDFIHVRSQVAHLIRGENGGA